MTRRLAAAIVLATLAGALPALASGVTVSSSTLDAYRTCILSGVSSTSTAVADTFVDQNSPNSNSGTSSQMDEQSRTSRNRRVYVRFDLSLCSPAIPATATVLDGQLDLFFTSRPSVCRTIDVFLLTATWAEGTITWNNQPVGTSTNNPPTAQRGAFTTIGASPCTYSTANTYASWPVTTDVQSFVAGTATNHGWMLRDDTEESGTERRTRFSTAEANRAERAPRLVITYRP